MQYDIISKTLNIVFEPKQKNQAKRDRPENVSALE